MPIPCATHCLNVSFRDYIVRGGHVLQVSQFRHFAKFIGDFHRESLETGVRFACSNFVNSRSLPAEVRMSSSKTFSFCLVLLAFVVLSFTLACGGSSHSSSNLSQAQVQAMTAEMQGGFATAANTITADPCVGGASNQFCFDTSVNCSGGGTVDVTAQMTSNLDVNDTGQINGTITLTPTNCSVRNANLVLNGDPSLKFTSSVNLLNGGLTTLTATETGAVSYGPDPQGVCETNLTITATATTCSIKGTECGQQVNYTCQ